MATKKQSPSRRKSQSQITRESRSKEEDAVRLRLIAAREAAGLTRRQMAEKLGCRYLSLKAWELSRFRTPMVVALAAEMWCELNDIDITPRKKKEYMSSLRRPLGPLAGTLQAVGDIA